MDEKRIKEILNADLFKDLTEEEKRLALKLVEDSKLREEFWRKNHKFHIVPIDEFLTPYYIGETANYIYPIWKDALNEIFAPNSSIAEVIFSGAIGIGKTTTGVICMVRVLYELTSLKNPAKYFGITPMAPIVLAFYSLTLSLTKISHMLQFMQILSESQHFIEATSKKQFQEYCKDPTINFVPYFIDSDGIIRFPNNICVIGGSRESHSLSLNIFAGMLDEAEFRKSHGLEEAFSLYTSVKNRITSRFLGKIGHLQILISSKRYKDSVVEKYIKSVEKDKATKVYSYPIWKVKPQNIYSGKKFKVFIGSNTLSPRIVTDIEIKELGLSENSIIEVPIEYKTQFELDIYEALRSIAGIATQTTTPLFPSIEMIEMIFDRTILNIENDIISRKDENFIIDALIDKKIFVKGNRGYKIYRAPGEMRFLHIDLSETKDFTGIAMCHKEKSSYSENGKVIYVWDFAFRIDPGSFGINQFAIENFIKFLLDTGLRFKLTMDRYQSAHILQYAKSMLIDASLFSVDSNPEAYFLLKNYILEERIKIGYSDTIKKEFVDLEDVDGKIQTKSNNDVSDAIAGSFWNCVNDTTVPIYVFDKTKMSNLYSQLFEKLTEGRKEDFDIWKVASNL